MSHDPKQKSLSVTFATSPAKLLMRLSSTATKGIESLQDYWIFAPRKRRRGRPKGSRRYDDELHLIEMGRLLETREAGKLHHAATTVVQGGQVPGASTEAKIKRLSEAFKKDEEIYRRLGRQKIAKDETPENL